MSNVSQYRTQLLLDEKRYVWLKEEAKETDRSLADLVREAIDELKEKRAKKKRRQYSAAYKRLLALAGSVTERNGVDDVSENHDKYLGEALYNDLMKNRR